MRSCRYHWANDSAARRSDVDCDRGTRECLGQHGVRRDVTQPFYFAIGTKFNSAAVIQRYAPAALGDSLGKTEA